MAQWVKDQAVATAGTRVSGSIPGQELLKAVGTAKKKNSQSRIG